MKINWKVKFEYRNRFGVCQVSGGIKNYWHYLSRFLWGKITGRGCEIIDYVIKPHFKGWPENMIGKTINIKVLKISIPYPKLKQQNL